MTNTQSQYTPKYTLTLPLLNNLSEIERLYGKLESTQVPASLLLNLEQHNLIQSSYSSNKIEGNPLEVMEVTNLLLNDRVPVNRDEKEVVNYFQILKHFEEDSTHEINLGLILELHSKLMRGVDDEITGHVRAEQVVVGLRTADNHLIIKHNPPYHTPAQIEKALSDLCIWVKDSPEPPMLKAGIFHHEFVYIHPFVDGNGRVCRLLTALILLKAGYKINRYFVLDDYYDIDRHNYSDELHLADAGDKTDWLIYFTEGVKYSLQSALGKIESGLSRLDYDIRPTPKERKTLEIAQKYRQITSADLVKELSVTRQQAHNLLKALTEKGYLEKRGSTKNSYYIFK